MTSSENLPLCNPEEETPLHSIQYSLEKYHYATGWNITTQGDLTKINRSLICGIILVVLGLYCIYSTPSLACISLFVGIFMVIRAIKSKKSYQSPPEQVPEGTRQYRWDLYEDHCVVTICRDGQQHLQQLLMYTDMQRTWHRDGLVVIQAKNALFLMPESVIPEDSPLWPVIREKLVTVPRRQSLEKWSTGLTLASCAALLLVAYLGWNQGYLLAFDFFEYSWVAFFCLPLPIASIVVSTLVKKRGLPWKRNLLLSIAVAVLMSGFGCLTFYNSMYDRFSADGEAYLSTVEERLDIVLPDSEYANHHSTGGTASGNDRIFLLSSSYATYYGQAQNALNEQLAQDPRWLQSVPYDLLPAVPLDSIHPEAEYFLLFNITSGTYNTLPETAGTHTMLYITYNFDNGYLSIEEYEYEVTP